MGFVLGSIVFVVGSLASFIFLPSLAEGWAALGITIGGVVLSGLIGGKIAK